MNESGEPPIEYTQDVSNLEEDSVVSFSNISEGTEEERQKAKGRHPSAGKVPKKETTEDDTLA